MCAAAAMAAGHFVRQLCYDIFNKHFSSSFFGSALSAVGCFLYSRVVAGHAWAPVDLRPKPCRKKSTAPSTGHHPGADISRMPRLCWYTRMAAVGTGCPCLDKLPAALCPCYSPHFLPLLFSARRTPRYFWRRILSSISLALPAAALSASCFAFPLA
jgi:hypothetical protein